MSSLKRLYTTKELSEMLSIHENTIFKMRKKGLPYKKIGRSVRFNYDDVIEWLENKNKEGV